MKLFKLQMLTTKFENIRTKEDETFTTFYSELSDTVNSSLNQREEIPDSKVVRKFLRPLPKRFRPKVTSIEESKNNDSLRVYKLVGSLQTYQMPLPNSQKPKETTFKASKNERKSW